MPNNGNVQVYPTPGKGAGPWHFPTSHWVRNMVIWGKQKNPRCFGSQYWQNDPTAQRESSEDLAREPLPASHVEAGEWVSVLLKWT